MEQTEKLSKKPSKMPSDDISELIRIYSKKLKFEPVNKSESKLRYIRNIFLNKYTALSAVHPFSFTYFHNEITSYYDLVKLNREIKSLTKDEQIFKIGLFIDNYKDLIIKRREISLPKIKANSPKETLLFKEISVRRDLNKKLTSILSSFRTEAKSIDDPRRKSETEYKSYLTKLEEYLPLLCLDKDKRESFSRRFTYLVNKIDPEIDSGKLLKIFNSKNKEELEKLEVSFSCPNMVFFYLLKKLEYRNILNQNFHIVCGALKLIRLKNKGKNSHYNEDAVNREMKRSFNFKKKTIVYGSHYDDFKEEIKKYDEFINSL